MKVDLSRPSPLHPYAYYNSIRLTVHVLVLV